MSDRFLRTGRAPSRRGTDNPLAAPKPSESRGGMFEALDQEGGEVRLCGELLAASTPTGDRLLSMPDLLWRDQIAYNDRSQPHRHRQRT
jgi:hypothetical protein